MLPTLTHTHTDSKRQGIVYHGSPDIFWALDKQVHHCDPHGKRLMSRTNPVSLPIHIMTLRIVREDSRRYITWKRDMAFCYGSGPDELYGSHMWLKWWREASQCWQQRVLYSTRCCFHYHLFEAVADRGVQLVLFQKDCRTHVVHNAIDIVIIIPLAIYFGLTSCGVLNFRSGLGHKSLFDCNDNFFPQWSWNKITVMKQVIYHLLGWYSKGPQGPLGCRNLRLVCTSLGVWSSCECQQMCSVLTVVSWPCCATGREGIWNKRQANFGK